MLQVNWPVVDTAVQFTHKVSNKFAVVVKIKATGELKLNNSPDNSQISIENNTSLPFLWPLQSHPKSLWILRNTQNPLHLQAPVSLCPSDQVQ